jgi:hypothetical protein
MPPGKKISATITAQGNNFTSTAIINQTVYQTGFWDDIPTELEFCRNDIVAGAYDGKIWSITGKGASNVRTSNVFRRLQMVDRPAFLTVDKITGVSPGYHLV